MRRPDRNRSLALPKPTRAASNLVLANSGTRPILMKPMPNRAVVEATIWSAGRHIVTPIPTAAPLMAHTMGLLDRTRATQSRPAGIPPTPPAVSRPGSTPSMRDLNVASISAPAQKPRPSPVITMAPIAGSSLAAVIACACSSAIVGVQAFSLSGRFRVITITAPSRRVEIWV